MKGIGRNEPCPCGSGKKYKRCCLAKDDELRRHWQHRREAMEIALGFLFDRHEAAVDEELASFFFETTEYLIHLEDLAPLERQVVEANAIEWLLAEAWIDVGDERRSALSLVLEEVGPKLADEQRRWLEMMGRHAISLYEVREIRPGSTLLLQDLTDSRRPLLELVEHAVADEVEVGDAFGARLLPMGERWLRTPALYPFEPSSKIALQYAVEELPRELADEPSLEEADYPWEYGGLVVAHWLAQCFRDVVDPEDFMAHEVLEPPVQYVNHYRVNDWERLAAALAERDDVRGDRTGGWTRIDFEEHAPPDEDEDDEEDLGIIWRQALNPVEPEGLDVVASIEEDADEGIDWLEEVAGDAVTYLGSDEIEPFEEEHDPDDAYFDLPPAAKTERAQAYFEKFYRDWPERPIPILQGKPPALAARTEEGRAAVARLIWLYEMAEGEEAEAEEREPASFAFLWRAMGLDREAEIRRIEASSPD